MAALSSSDFESWLPPRDALAKIGGAAKEQIATRILDSIVRIAGKRADKAGGEWECITDRDYLCGPWLADWDAFWSSSQVSFVRIPVRLDGVARLNIVGPADSLPQPEAHIFHKVRLDPTALASEFDLDSPLVAAIPQKEGMPVVRKGGRPSGMHGEPIARITMGLAGAGDVALERETAEALSVDLIAEYGRLGLGPPSKENAVKFARGILRAVRK